MLFKNPPKLPGKSLIERYLDNDLWSWFKDLTTGLVKLNFNENFESFIVRDLVIPATTEVTIANGFKGRFPGLVPSYRLIVRQTVDNTVVDGDKAWTADNVYLKNIGASSVKITVIFFR